MDFVSIITSPITFSIMLPFYSEMFENLLKGGSVQDLYTSIFSLYSKALVPLYFSTLFSLIASYFISPIFKSLFYLDLKFRKKEIGTEPREVLGEVTGTDSDDSLEININDEQ